MMWNETKWSECCWYDKIRAQSRIRSELVRVVVRFGLWCEQSVSTANEKILFARAPVIGSWEYQSVQETANQDVRACLSPRVKICAYIKKEWQH
jgi:hypothetical protein